MITPSPADFSQLDAQLAGRALVAGDEGWDDARLAWNLVADQHPPATVVALNADDVAATIRFAAEHGLRVAPQTTGHAATQLAGLDDTIILRTGSLDLIEVDAGSRTARLGGGVLALPAATATAEHGLTPVLGSAVDVGTAGFSLGGGLGWLARSHGLACNSIRGAELVTGAGEILRVDAASDPDLFWAIRGGGGAFGVVTELEVELYDTGELLAGDVMFDVQHAPAVFEAYRAWVADAPTEVTSSIRLLTPPPAPTVPEPIRGRPMVTVTAACAGDPEAAEALLAPLRAVAPTVTDSYARVPASALSRIHGDPEQPVPGFTAGCLLDDLSAETFDALLEACAGSSLLQVDFRQLGGALAEPAVGAGAQSHLPGAFAVAAVGAVMGPGAAGAIESDLGRLMDVLAPSRRSVGFMNFDDRPGDGSAVFDQETHARLCEIKARVDPQGTVRGGQDIPPRR